MTAIQGAASVYEYTLGTVRVFVVPPTRAHTDTLGDTTRFDWPSTAASWVEEARLLPVSSQRQVGSLGTATFRLLRRTREENGNLVAGDPGKFAKGCYIAIATGIAQTFAANGTPQLIAFDATKVKWWGWVTAVDAQRFADADDESGVVTAQELGGLLDSSQLTGWQQESTDPNYSVAISTPPTANMSIADGIIVGNRIAGPAGESWFARRAADCGQTAAKVWTRWRLLSHLIAYCKPANIPTLSVVASVNLQAFLDDTTLPEVYELYGLTMKGALDMLLPRARGVGWYLAPKTDLSGWAVNVYSHDPTGAYLKTPAGVAVANTPVDVTADDTFADVSYSESASEEFDEVVIRGERVVVGATVAYGDGNLDAGWLHGSSGDQEDLFRKCTGVTYPTSPTPGDKIARNTEKRQGPGLDRVFTTFALKADSNGTIGYKTPPGLGTGTAKAIAPRVTWDSTAKTINLANDSGNNLQPYIPTARILRWLPWPKTVDPDGTDRRSAAEKVQPEYLPPRVFRYLASPPAYDREKWINLMTHGAPQDSGHVQRGTPSVSADDRSFAIRIECSPPEMLARNHWSVGDAAMAWYPLTPNDTSGSAKQAIDWQSLVATIAFETDQRVEVSAIRPGLPSAAASRRQLVISEPGLKFWMVLQGTILGLDSATSGGAMQPWRVSATNAESWATSGQNAVAYVTRNDYPTAQRLCDMVAAWVFRRRMSASIRLKHSDTLPVWAELGTMIGKVIDRTAGTGVAEGAITANTVVESIAYDWNARSPSVTVTTTVVERPELPRLAHGRGSSSPTAGGAVSAQLGGTTAQAVAGLQADVLRLESHTQKLPILPPRALGGAATSLMTVVVIGGNTLGSGQAGIKYSSSAITDAPSAYDPDVTSSFADYFGRGNLYIDGVLQANKVLIVNDLTGGAVNFALLVNDVVVVATPRTLTVGGDPNTTITAYSPLFL